MLSIYSPTKADSCHLRRKANCLTDNKVVIPSFILTIKADYITNKISCHRIKIIQKRAKIKTDTVLGVWIIFRGF